MNIRFLGHSAIEINSGSTSILVDPFISGNPVCPVKPEELNPTHILLTHFHGDHVGDTEELAKRTGALVIGGFDGVAPMQGRGIRVHGMALGGKYHFDFGMVRMTMAFHGSGALGAHPNGYVIHIGGKRIYHAGDTCLFSDMKLLNGVIEEPGIDLALLPVGDNFTMGPEDAAVAVEWIAPRVVIPIHWGTFPVLLQDPTEFSRRVQSSGKARVVVLRPGETYAL